jgi:short-subunit dehydrogenase
MDLKLAGKTALITGASKGIGRATAEILASEGCNLILVARTATDLEAVKNAIARKANVRVDTIAADLSDSENVTRRPMFPRMASNIHRNGRATTFAPCSTLSRSTKPIS